MSKSYEQLITEISEVATTAFNGRQFERIEPVDDGEMWQIASGSERHLYGYDEQDDTEIDVTEQYVVLKNGEGIAVARHYLQVAWDNYDDDQIVSLDLDEGRINDPNDDTYSDAEAVEMAQRVLRFVKLIMPDIVQAIPDNDLGGFEQYLTEAAMLSDMERNQLASVKIAVAVADDLVGHVAKRELNGEEFREHLYARIVTRLRKKYGLSEAEVDQVIDIRMQEIERARIGGMPQ